MKALQGMVAALAFVLAASASGAEPKVHKMRMWTTPSFVVYSHDEARTRKIVQRAAGIEKLLGMLTRREPLAANPIHVVIVRDSVWKQYLRPSNMIAAEFVPARFASYVLISDWQDFEAQDHLVDHEFTHAFLRRLLPGHIPLWLDEGFAEFIDNSMLLRDSVRLLPKGERGGRWIPMDRFLRADRSSPEYLTYQTVTFHHQAWAFVHKGMLDDRDFGRRTSGYLLALDQGASIDDAVQRSFGMDVAALDRVVQEYAFRRAYPTGRIPFDWPTPVRLDAGVELGEVDALDLLAKIMWDGALNATRLLDVENAAKRRGATANTSRQAFWATIRNPTDTIGFLRHATSIQGISEPAASRAAALALYGRIHEAGEDDPLPRETREDAAQLALKLLLQSERTLPTDPEAAWALAMLTSRLGGDRELALQRLRQARNLLPHNLDLRQAETTLAPKEAR
jgi:hypothetical protein